MSPPESALEDRRSDGAAASATPHKSDPPPAPEPSSHLEMCSTPAQTPAGLQDGPACGHTPDSPEFTHLEPRPFRPFKSSEEYLYAMKEDLAEWLNMLYELGMTVENFMETLDTGVVLCDHANAVRRTADQFQTEHEERRGRRFSADFRIPSWEVQYNRSARAGSFFARDNIHNFIRWCNELGVLDCLMFETEDLVSRKNEKHVILCLLEIARRGAKFGMAAPMLVQFERQIDREIARDNGDDAGDAGDDEELQDVDETPMVYGPAQQIVTNDLKSLDEMVRDLVERCACPSQFPMIRVSEGKYRIGDTKTLIFVRILRNHVMVRVGGGWDTLDHYLDKHDPCRCKSGHRQTIASRLFMKQGASDGERILGSVKYERLQDGGAEGPATDSSPPLRTPISFRSSPLVRRRPSGTPTSTEKRLFEEGSGDSSSEVSDEGYRSQGHWKFAHTRKMSGEHIDRPESSLTHSSTESGETNPEQPLSPSTPTAPTPPAWLNMDGKTTPKPKRSIIDSLKSTLRPSRSSTPLGTPPAGPGGGERRASVDAGRQRERGLQRSMSGGSEAGLRGSVRANRAMEARLARCGKNTWSGSRQRERPALGADTFRSPTSAGPAAAGARHHRATSASPGPHRKTGAGCAPPPRKTSAILADLMRESADLVDDDQVLQRMEQLVQQYRRRDAAAQRGGAGDSAPSPPPPAARVTPRKESNGKSRIPAPTFFQTRHPPPTETCL